MEQTINNIENYNYVINILEISAIIKPEKWWWLERHVGGGWECMIQFIVAQSCMHTCSAIHSIKGQESQDIRSTIIIEINGLTLGNFDWYLSINISPAVLLASEAWFGVHCVQQ